MDPGVGRFVSADRWQGVFTQPASLHRYQYASSSPLDRIDPSGNSYLLDLTIAAAIIGTLALIAWSCAPNVIATASSLPPAPGLLEEAFTSVGLILEDGGRCSKFFCGSAGERPNADELALATIRSIAKIGPYPGRSAVGIAQLPPIRISVPSMNSSYQIRIATTMLVNEKGPFFRGTDPQTLRPFPDIGGYRTGTREARIVMILHEMAHVIRANPSGAPLLIPDDNEDDGAGVSRDNSNVIRRECGGEIHP